MTSERSKRRDFIALVFISKSISKKLLIKISIVYLFIYLSTPATAQTTQSQYFLWFVFIDLFFLVDGGKGI